MVESLKEVFWLRPVSPISVVTAMQSVGIPEEQIALVMTTIAPDLPDDAIRAKDACEKYGIDSALLSYWCNKDYVWSLQVSRKLTYVSENDVARRAEELRAKQRARGVAS